MILAIDTSTDLTSIALYRAGNGVLAEQSWHSGRQQTTQLLPSIQRLMSLTELTVRDLEGIAVATGPGSFSGVRIGISTAKSIAYALGIKLWGVPSLDVLAYSQAAVMAADVCPLLNMGRGRLAWALYRTRGSKWQRLTPYAIDVAADLAHKVLQRESNVATLFCGELDPETAQVLVETGGSHASVAPPATGVRRAGYLAELAMQRSLQGEDDDPATLQAIYVQS